MKKYFAQAWIWQFGIVTREIQSETPAFVTLENGVRHKKCTKTDGYFNTWAEAHEFLVGAMQADVDSSRRNLEYARQSLEKSEQRLAKAKRMSEGQL